MAELRIDGLSAEEWLDMMFEFENCSECGKGKENHDVIVFLGNFFARCKD